MITTVRNHGKRHRGAGSGDYRSGGDPRRPGGPRRPAAEPARLGDTRRCTASPRVSAGRGPRRTPSTRYRGL